jgi:hypothetical protein
MVKRAVPSMGSFADKNTKMSSYVRRIAKKVSDQRAKGNAGATFTMSSQAVAEVELLIEHAINTIAHNTSAILKYSGAGTIDLKTMRVATKTAFTGPLRKDVHSAGQLALETFEAAMSKPKPPKPSKAVAA